ncbi:unnamed protein product [Cylicocyclus nassatus]|uniref:DUF5648 domain-containing protein n=1 Tax=Cylicocyclus nassatus TaxID=53992 RepID=A0AA36HGT0_CYLNA|nr:unnamed protein product [Cylicocyclus nassatus]
MSSCLGGIVFLALATVGLSLGPPGTNSGQPKAPVGSNKPGGFAPSPGDRGGRGGGGGGGDRSDFGGRSVNDRGGPWPGRNGGRGQIIEIERRVFGNGPGSNIWFIPYVAPLQRFYNPAADRHRFHTEIQPISTFLSNGYRQEPSPGRMITMATYNQQGAEISLRCPQIVPLFAVLNAAANAQKLTTSLTELNALIRGGWYRIPQVGYCVKGQACGATKPLRELRVTSKPGDVVYTTDANEFAVLNSNGPFQGSGTGAVCYLW